MPGSWKDYKDWKELMENIRNHPQQESMDYDDEVEDLSTQFKEYID